MSEETKKTMDLSDRLNMQTKKGDNVYIFSIPNNSPIGEAYDACFSILERIARISQEALEKMKEESADSAEAVISSEE